MRKAASYSIIAQNLLDIMAQLYQRSPLIFKPNRINGDDNDVADFLSRQDHQTLNTNPKLLLSQLFQKHPFLQHFQTFHPTAELNSILTLSLSSNVRIPSQKIPKHLGYFKPATCIISSGVLQ